MLLSPALPIARLDHFLPSPATCDTLPIPEPFTEGNHGGLVSDAWAVRCRDESSPKPTSQGCFFLMSLWGFYFSPPRQHNNCLVYCIARFPPIFATAQQLTNSLHSVVLIVWSSLSPLAHFPIQSEFLCFFLVYNIHLGEQAPAAHLSRSANIANVGARTREKISTKARWRSVCIWVIYPP